MKKTYGIEVDCANCANKMEQAAKETEGVKDCTVNFMALKMTVEFAETFATFLVEHKYFVTAALVVEHFANHFSALYIRSTNFYFTLIVEEQYVLKLNSRTFLKVSDAVDEQFLASFYSKLLAFHFYNCVHLNTFVKCYGGAAVFIRKDTYTSLIREKSVQKYYIFLE